LQMTFDVVRECKQEEVILKKTEALSKLQKDDDLVSWRSFVEKYYPEYRLVDVGVHELLLELL